MLTGDDSIDRLGPRGVLLHPGAPKAATTAIQSCLSALRPVLRERGVLYPGKQMNHVSASRSVVGASTSDRGAVDDARLWATLCRAVSRHDGRVVVSSELLAVCDASSAQRVVRELGERRVRVVLTLRPLDRVVPSAWQESVKAGGRTPFEDWAAAVTRRPGRAGTDDAGRFWVVHDQARFVSTWIDVVGPDKVTVAVLDPDRPGAVFDIFERLIGLPAGTLDPTVATLRNRSLTWPEAEVIRAYNELAEIPGEFERVADLLSSDIVHALLEHRTPPADETRLELPPSMVEGLVGFCTDAVERIRASGAHVEGDLTALIPEVRDTPRSPTAPSTTAVDIAAHLLRAQHAHIRPQRAARRSTAEDSGSDERP